MCLLLRKNHLFRYWGCNSLLNWIWALALSLLLKLPPKKMKPSMKFLSPEIALHVYKSTIQPCMEHYCHAWAGAPSCCLEMLDKLQKSTCGTVGPSLAASFEPLSHRRNVTRLSIFYRYYFGHLNWLN